MMGDGFTMGVGVHDRDTFAARVEASLVANGSGEVINCGIPGFGSREVRAAIPWLAGRYNPDIVVVTLGLDDDRSAWEDRQAISTPSRWERVSAIWGQLGAAVRGRRTHEYASVAADLKAVAGEIRTRGGRLIVLVPRTSDDPLWDELAAAVTTGLAGSQAVVVDLGDAVRGGRAAEELIVAPHDLHPNELVHAAVAERLLPHLLAAPGGATATSSTGGN